MSRCCQSISYVRSDIAAACATDFAGLLRLARTLIAPILMAVSCHESSAQAADAPRAPMESAASTEQAREIDAMLSRYLKPDRPGAAIIVTRDGLPVFRKAYGVSNQERNVALEPEMALRAGSLTKQFTAAAIMLLVEQGKLALSDELGKYLANFPTSPTPVTIEHLLTHTSGIRNYTAFPDFRARMTMPVGVSEAITLFKDSKLEFKAGDRFAYSNSNYFLLGAIIEHVSGMPYPVFMEKAVFRPLQLDHTIIETDASARAPTLGYTRLLRRTAPAAPYSMSWPYAAGALRTTVDDLARWSEATANGKLLTPASWQRMSSSYRLAGGAATGYGYGWFVRTVGGRSVIEHSGEIGGFSAALMQFPKERLCIAILANSDALDPAPDALAEKIAALVLRR